MTDPSSLLLINDHDLQTDLVEFGQSVVRELYLATRKLEGGELEFSAVQRVLDRPLAHLRKWFRLFTVADVDLSGPALRFGGLELPQSAFGTGLSRLLRERGVTQLVCVPPVSTPELHALLKGLAAPATEGSLVRRLADREVRCVRLNDGEWQTRLALRPAPRIDASGRAPLRSYLLEHWAEAADLVCCAAACSVPDSDRLVLRWQCHATPPVVEAVLAERLASLPPQAVLEFARSQLEGRHSAGGGLPVPPDAAFWQHLLAAVVHHPYAYELTHALREMLDQHHLRLDVDELLDPQVRIQYDATRAVFDLTARVFSTACTVEDLKRWGPVFARLLRTGTQGQSASILEALLLHLKRDDREARRRAHYLLGCALAACGATGDQATVGWLSERIVTDLVAGEETYEFSDLLAGAGELLMSAGDWDALSKLASRLRTLQTQASNPARERVCQVVLERWRQPQWIARLFRAVEEEGRSAGAVAALAALGGRDVAHQAASLITHSERRVRLAMLELLSGLGADAVAVCLERLSPRALWQNRGAGGTLADESWYTVRNILHILGRVAQEDVLPVLRQYQGDPDQRVRLEIVRALERHGSAEARALLVELAEDPATEVRRAAITAIGTTGGDHEVFILQEFLRSDPETAETTLLAMGHIGGRAAKDLLFAVLETDQVIAGAGLLHRAEALRDAALKALVHNPDSEIVSRIEAFCRKTGRTFRIPLVTDSQSQSGRVRMERARDRLGRP
jgi:hypothetical protein